MVTRRLFMAAPLALRAARRHSDLPDPTFDFTLFFVSWGGTTTPEFYRFLEATRPEIVQVGFYGPMFHGYADNPASTGYPMQLPVSGQREAMEVQRKVIERIHALGSKVVAHFQMVNSIQIGGGRRDNFTDFYAHRWPQDILGPKPHADVRELLQRDAAGEPIIRKHYVVDYVGFCLNSPHARQALKQMLKVALDAGVDGIITNYNYHWSCLCAYCQSGFKKYLAERFTPAQLRARFGIGDLAAHRFTRIAAEIPGYPDTKTAAPLDWEAARWGALAFKRNWDEVLIGYGRARKPNLILATWDHLGDVNVTEERAFTPIELWGKGENYFWYSGGYGPTKLAEHQAGEGWLDYLYMREMGGGKPFILGKYENIRMRNTLAEAAATGGAGMGLQIAYHESEGFEIGVRYLRFLREHKALYRPAEPWADVGLVFPRQAILDGDSAPADVFRKLGHALIDEHVLFDVVLDQRMTAERLARYPVVILPAPMRHPALERYRGALLTAPTLEQVKAHARPALEAPWTLRVAAWRQERRLLLHLVNYDRDERKAATLKGPAAECPIAVRNVRVNLRMPTRVRVEGVRLLSPDAAEPAALGWKQEGGRIEFLVPEVLVYGLIQIDCA